MNDPAAREAAGLADKAPGLAGKAGNHKSPRQSQSKYSQHAWAGADKEGHVLLRAEAELAERGDSENMVRTARSSMSVKARPAVPSLAAASKFTSLPNFPTGASGPSGANGKPPRPPAPAGAPAQSQKPPKRRPPKDVGPGWSVSTNTTLPPELALVVGPARHRSPRHKDHSNSRNEGLQACR